MKNIGNLNCIKRKNLNEIDDFEIWKKKYPNILNNPYKDLVKLAKRKNLKDHLKIFNDVRKKLFVII